MLEELEETARLWMLASGPDRPGRLSDEQIEELRVHFGARW